MRDGTTDHEEDVMLPWKIRLTVIVCGMCVAIACSQSRIQAASVASGEPADAIASSSADTTVAVPIDCNKVFSPSDAAGLLDPPVKLSAIGEGTGWCDFGNEKLGDITVRTGSGQEDKQLFEEATVSTDRVNFVPLPGVGDQAVRRASDGSEIASKKGNMYCSVSILGDAPGKRLGGEELAKRLGALCNKVFSAK